jgi:hypothetical protein
LGARAQTTISLPELKRSNRAYCLDFHAETVHKSAVKMLISKAFGGSKYAVILASVVQ